MNLEFFKTLGLSSLLATAVFGTALNLVPRLAMAVQQGGDGDRVGFQDTNFLIAQPSIETPSPEATPEESPSPEATPEESPSPEATPEETPLPDEVTPEESPSPEVSPLPEITPSPEEIPSSEEAPTTAPTPSPIQTSPSPNSGQYVPGAW